jgi:hypothetical protein
VVVPWTLEAIMGIVDEAYFDASFGHFRLSSASRFKAWLNQFLMKSGYAARYTSGSVLRRVG